MRKKIRIGINAQIPSGSGAGGIETVLRALTPLGRLEDGDEEYVFITHWSDPFWLKPFLTERQEIVPAPSPAQQNEAKNSAFGGRLMKKLMPLARRVKNRIASSKKDNDVPVFSVPVSDGFYESLNCDVIHFPYQDYVYCRTPTIYNPHDLQHLHYSQFFAPEEILRREIVYPAACRAARTVVAASQFVKQDLIEKYEIEAEKIQVIPWSPPEIPVRKFSEDRFAEVLAEYKCPPRPFMLFPAMTWEHKNHLRLLRAIALLRNREDLIVNLVCTGYKHSFYSQIERLIGELKLEKQVTFTGIVSIEDLSLLYRQAQFVIIPTLFEAASGPLYEAWQHDVAATCSAVTSLPEQAAGAALLFDPFSVEDIAAAVKRMVSDEDLRDELRCRGRNRLADFDPSLTAKAYRAVYRKTAGADLSEEDRYLLNWDWMSNTQPE